MPFRAVRSSCGSRGDNLRHVTFSAYLLGLHAARPSAFAEGERFELPKRFAACLVSSEVLSSTQPTFHFLS